eukprot:758478-Hanusia_phi.AAC.1
MGIRGFYLFFALALVQFPCHFSLAGGNYQLSLFNSNCSLGNLHAELNQCLMSLSRGRYALPQVQLRLVDRYGMSCCQGVSYIVQAKLYKRGREVPLSGKIIVKSTEADGIARFTQLQLDSFEAGKGYQLQFSTFLNLDGSGSIEYFSRDFTILPESIVLHDSNSDFELQANAPVPTYSFGVAATDFTTLISESLGNNLLVYEYLGRDYQIKISDGHYDLSTLNNELSKHLGQNITLSWSENRVKAVLQQGFRALLAGSSFGVFLGFSLSTSLVQAHASVLVADWDRNGLLTANLTRERVGNLTLIQGIDLQDDFFATVHLLDLRAGLDITGDHLHGNLTHSFESTFVSFSGLTLQCLIGTYQAVVKLLIRQLNTTIFIHEAYLHYDVVPKSLYLDNRSSVQGISVNLEEQSMQYVLR